MLKFKWKFSKLSQEKQLKLIEHFVAGTTARTASALIGINRKTAILYYHNLRELIFEYEREKEKEIFNGEIEVDESYVPVVFRKIPLNTLVVLVVDV